MAKKKNKRAGAPRATSAPGLGAKAQAVTARRSRPRSRGQPKAQAAQGAAGRLVRAGVRPAR